MTGKFSIVNHPNKKQERKKAMEAFVRQGMLDAVISLLMRDGVQGITMDRVATEAGVAKGTLYAYFKNKEEILEAAIEASFEPLILELTRKMDADKAPDERLADFSRHNLQFFDEKQDLVRVLFYDRERTDSGKNHFNDSRYLGLLNKVAGVLSEGVSTGLFVPLNPMKVASMFIEANMGMVMQRIRDEVSGDIEEDAKQITDIFIKGLRNNQ